MVSCQAGITLVSLESDSDIEVNFITCALMPITLLLLCDRVLKWIGPVRLTARWNCFTCAFMTFALLLLGGREAVRAEQAADFGEEGVEEQPPWRQVLRGRLIVFVACRDCSYSIQRAKIIWNRGVPRLMVTTASAEHAVDLVPKGVKQPALHQVERARFDGVLDARCE